MVVGSNSVTFNCGFGKCIFKSLEISLPVLPSDGKGIHLQVVNQKTILR